MVRKENLNIPFYRYETWDDFEDEIIHFITTRHGGVSDGHNSSLNIGYGTDDFSVHVLENRHRMAGAMNIPLDYFVMANQVHDTRVEVVTKKMRGMGALYRDNSLLATDSMITGDREVCLFVMGADCVPLLFFDPEKRIIGAAHAGWRGTVKKIAAKTVGKMSEEYGCNPGEIRVGIGPSIGPCCYEVGGEVSGAVADAFPGNSILIIHRNSSMYFNLWEANKLQLLEAGIQEKHIETSGLCTKCNSGDFFSSRAGNGNTGRFGAGIMLR